MTFDFTNLTAGQVALIAGVFTLMAAATSGLAALLVAWVNARSAMKLEKAKARRDYHRSQLEPVVKRIEEDIPRYLELAETIARRRRRESGKEIGPGAATLTAMDEEILSKLFHELFQSDVAIDSVVPSVRSILWLDKHLEQAFDAYRAAAKQAEKAFMANTVGASRTLKADYQPGEAYDNAQDVITKIVHLRAAAEDFIFR